jgi:hypothetical protein
LSFGDVLNDIDDVTEIDDFGRDAGSLWTKSGIPPGTANSLTFKKFEVLSVTASIVEERHLSSQDFII